MEKKRIQLLTNATIGGVLRSPGEGPIMVSVDDADKLVGAEEARLAPVDMSPYKRIRIVDRARVNGILRTKADGPLDVPVAEADRLIAQELAVDASAEQPTAAAAKPPAAPVAAPAGASPAAAAAAPTAADIRVGDQTA